MAFNEALLRASPASAPSRPFRERQSEPRQLVQRIGVVRVAGLAFQDVGARSAGEAVGGAGARDEGVVAGLAEESVRVGAAVEVVVALAAVEAVLAAIAIEDVAAAA